MNSVKQNDVEARIGRTAFWTLWTATMLFSIYGLAGELFGGPFLFVSDLRKFHMSIEGTIVERVSFVSGILLVLWSVFLWSVSRSDLTKRMRGKATLAIVVMFFYQALPRF